MWRTLFYKDENDKPIRHLITERKEQILCEEFIEPTATVLELGARYGTVSCVINKKLINKLAQVSVEPDSRVWDALEKNRDRNDCKFNIVKGFISSKKLSLQGLDVWKGYGTYSVEDEKSEIKSYSLKEIQEIYNLTFDTLVADCEGFLETFLDENPDFLKQIHTIIFEKDCPTKCNYRKIQTMLHNDGFKLVGGFNKTTGKSYFRVVWKR